MAHADALRLTPLISSIDTFELTKELLVAAQQVDPWLQDVQKNPEKWTAQVVNEVWMVVKDVDEGELLVPMIPRSLRNRILQVCHDSPWAGHPDLEVTTDTVRMYGIWPNLAKYVKEYVQMCPTCQKRNSPNNLETPIQKPELPSHPGEIVGIDHVGPLATPTGEKYLLTVIDHFSKYAEAYVVPNTTAQEVVDVLTQKYFPVHGIPKKLMSDRGTAFIAAVTKELCGAWGIGKVQTAAYHPQSNITCERFHQTLAYVIAKLTTNTTEWQKVLPIALATYRNEPHVSTGYTPNMLHLGREIRLPVTVSLHIAASLLVTTSPSHGHMLRCVKRAHQVVTQALRKAWETRAKVAHSRRTPRYFREGDPVYLCQLVPPPGISPKFWCPWIGPMKVTRCLTEAKYEIVDAADRYQVVHLSCLKPANERGVPDDSYITSPLDSVLDRQPEPVPYFHNVEEEMLLDDGDLPVTRIRTSVTPPTLQVGEVHPESPAHHATPESPLCQEEPMETATPPLSPVPTNAPSTPATLPVEEAQMTRMVEGSTRRQLRSQPRLDYQQLLKGAT